MQKLLAIGTDAKTVKGEKKGYLTGIMYMIPDDTLCPASKIAGCREGCLVSAGRGVMSPVKAGRAKMVQVILITLILLPVCLTCNSTTIQSVLLS